VEERLKWTRNPEQVRDHLEWYTQAVCSVPAEFLSMQQSERRNPPGGARCFRFSVALRDGGERLLCVVETPEGLRVDWDAFARFGTLPEGGPHRGDFTEAEVRALAKPCHYYDHGFSSEEEWLSFELSSPDWDDVVYGYAARISRTATILQSLASSADPGGAQVTLTLLGGAQDSEHRQYLVREILGVGWVLDGGNFEEGWEGRHAGSGAPGGPGGR
jgi:hypothetical protein